MPCVTSHGVKINYEVHGDASNPPLLLCNGYGPPLEYVVKFYMPAFLDRFYCATYDIRGVGESAAPEEDSEFSILRLAQDGMTVIDDLGWDSTHVWGVSLGAIFGARRAVAAPERVRSLVLTGLDCGEPNVHQRKYAETVRSRFAYLREPMQPELSAEQAAEKMISFFGPTDTPVGKKIIEYYASTIRNQKKKLRDWSLVSRFVPIVSDVEEYIANLPDVADPPAETRKGLLDHLEKIQSKTLIMHGYFDPIIHRDSALYALGRIPNAELRLSKETKHSFSLAPHLMSEQADWVAKREVEFQQKARQTT